RGPCHHGPGPSRARDAFESLQRRVHQEAEVNFMEQAAKQLAVAVDNAVNFEQAQSVRQQLTEQHNRFKLLLDVNNSVVSALDLRELLTVVSASLRRLVPHEFASLSLYDAETHSL